MANTSAATQSIQKSKGDIVINFPEEAWREILAHSVQNGQDADGENPEARGEFCLIKLAW